MRFSFAHPCSVSCWVLSKNQRPVETTGKKENYRGFLCLPSPVQVYTNLPDLFAFNKYNWSRTSLINRRLVSVFNCMCLSYLNMLKSGSLLLGVLMGTQRHCPRHCQGSMPVPQIYNIEARWSWPIDLCVEEEMRQCSQAALKSFLSGPSQESCVYVHWLSCTKDSGSMFPSLVSLNRTWWLGLWGRLSCTLGRWPPVLQHF